MLTTSNLRKKFSAESVLRGVDFSLGPGELVGLIGVSGSGKTVLARCLTGLEVFDQGMVHVDDLVFGSGTDPDDEVLSKVRQKAGFVTQNRALPPYRTVLCQVMEGPRYVLGLSERSAQESARSLLDQLGLAEHVHKYPSELSGGQLARVCLARAMIMEPSYLICDEVTANLDPVRAAEVAHALLQIVANGVGILLISHQLDFIRKFAARVDYLDRGEIVASGKPGEMLVNPRDPRLAEFLANAAIGR